MNKQLVFTAAAGALAGLLAYAGIDHLLRDGAPASAADQVDASAAATISRLEAQLADARSAKARLETQLLEQVARLQALQQQQASGDNALAHTIDSALASPATSPEALAAAEKTAQARGAGTSSDGADPLARYLSSGMDPVLAARLSDRNDEMTLARMNLRDRAEREGWLDSPRYAQEQAAIASWYQDLRPEIGDEAYDQFLFASGRPNRVVVREVLTGGAGASAGLQVGDTIMSYGTERIFDTRALQDASVAGSAGAQTLVEVLRDGQRLTLYLPRGPLGAGVRTGSANPATSTNP
ncbi:MAG: PDZ domain-containing protein [Pseudomonadota bacterium]